MWKVGYMGTSGNRGSQLASKSALNDFKNGALAKSTGRLFQIGTARMLKAYWRQWVQNLCKWNL